MSRFVGNLPTELTSFVGRRRELSDIRRLLSESRLVTLTGPGGVGKTRLALRAAEQLRRAFPDGVWLVELASLASPDLLPQMLASSFGLRDDSPDLTERLAAYLADKHLLVVLDNCEHLADACAVLLGRLLPFDAGLSVLATSRHRLGVNGEVLMDVPALEWAEGATSEAVNLFMDRARAAGPGCEPDSGERHLVVEVCRRLDGIPLAIELAAVWLRTLSVGDIVAQLEDRFRLLSTGSTAAVPRQRRLDTLVEWSYDLCSPQERLLWQRLSVFRGGFDLPAAEEVCEGDGIGRDEVLLLLANLLDESVITRDDNSPDRRARYRMLETIQAFGWWKLETAGHARAVRLRHRDYYARLASTYRAHQFTSQQQDWIIRLRGEHPNLRAALEFCLAEPGEARQPLSIAADLRNYWIVANHLSEGQRWLTRALERDTDPTDARAAALRNSAVNWAVMGAADDVARTVTDLEKIIDSVDNPAVRVGADECRALAGLVRGHIPAAVALLRDVLAARKELGDHALTADALTFTTILETVLGDTARAIAHGDEFLALCREHGPQWYTANALWLAGMASWRGDDWARAKDLEIESVRLREHIHDHAGLAATFDVLSWCAVSQGRHRRAARLKGAATTMYRLSGARTGEILTREFSEQTTVRARAALGADRFDFEFAAGTHLTLDQAIAYAVEAPSTGRPVSGTRSGRQVAPAHDLTRREFEVANLIAVGMSNREIAGRLVISPRTAEAHVEHILSKLGYTSRTQVAGWVAALRASQDSIG